MIPGHPCGGWVDYIRTAYTADMHLWQGDPSTVRVRWFRAPEGARQVCRDNVMSSSTWDELRDQDYALGEVADSRRYDARKGGNPVGYRGRRFCGNPRVFQLGGLHGVDPAITTDADGNAACCGARGAIGIAGIGFGSPPPLEKRWVGGKGIGGEWAEQRSQVYDLVGGKGAGGEWSVEGAQLYPWAGGKGAGGEWGAHTEQEYDLVGGKGAGGEWSVEGAQLYPWAGGKGAGGEWSVETEQEYDLVGGKGAGGEWSVLTGSRESWGGGSGGGGSWSHSSGVLIDWAGGKGAGGEWVSAGGPEVQTGLVMDFAGTIAPSGWLVCDGSAVSRSTYADLFGAIGTTWGAGDGSTTFNLPDLRRRVRMGSGGTSVSGPANTVGSVGGSETHQLTITQMPSHAHGQQIVTANTGGIIKDTLPATTTGAGATAQNQQTASQGSNAVHNNVQPSAVFLPCIKT